MADEFTDDLYPALIRFSFEEEVARIERALGYKQPVEQEEAMDKEAK